VQASVALQAAPVVQQAWLLPPHAHVRVESQVRPELQVIPLQHGCPFPPQGVQVVVVVVFKQVSVGTLTLQVLPPQHACPLAPH